jgi:hyaluronoglucosaminidase
MYVCVYITGVVPINVATNTALPAIAVGDRTTIAITPNGKTAYVPHSLEETVTPVNLATGKVLPAITTGPDPLAIAITP